ncbi:hypothetical protein LTR37_015773 [Vermiconidia calcicola]|uniref:Uncharacterized protein n=1 Tax=Vermiconidia calcicola TaxID=1690605 RepID=A0ACC3MQZ1_9PEZI|nr:hypothetical protein LTR37_015773 [Vermiconidia calcicola]
MPESSKSIQLQRKPFDTATSPSSPLLPPPGVSAVDFYTEQARAKAKARLASRDAQKDALQEPLFDWDADEDFQNFEYEETDFDEADFDQRLDRYIRQSGQLLIEANASLREPVAKLPRLPAVVVETSEKRTGAGAQVTELLAQADKVSAEEAYVRGLKVLEMEFAKAMGLPPSPTSRGEEQKPCTVSTVAKSFAERKAYLGYELELKNEIIDGLTFDSGASDIPSVVERSSEKTADDS